MANINIRIDNDLKRRAEKVFDTLGLTPSTAIVLFYKQVVRTNSIPFELSADGLEENKLKALEEMQKLFGDSSNMTGDDIVEEIKKYLNKKGIE